MLGWVNLFHCEINPFGRKILDYWFPDSKSYEDITNTDFSEWRGRVNVLTGGFPCQPFSYAGKRGGAQDDRYLWPYMFRCIDQIRPDWVVAENVAGILTMVEQGEVSEVASAPALFDTFDRVRRYQLRETFTLQRICDDLESHGYAVQPVLVPACGVGAPHRRDRVFIIGHRIASDTDDGTDRRTAREDEGTGREERIQERHEVRKPDESNQVRPASATISEDPLHVRCSSRQDEEPRSERDERDTRTGDSERLRGETSGADSADTHRDGHQPSQESRGLESGGRSDNGESGEWCEQAEWTERFYSVLRHHADTDREGLERAASLRVQGHEGRGQFDGIRECAWDSREGISGTGRWESFPSVSPVHR